MSSPIPVSTQPRQGRWLHYLVAFLCGGVFSVALLFVFATNGITLLGIDAGPGAVAIVGEVRLQPGQYRATNEQVASQCTGSGTFSDIGPGATVVVIDDTDPGVVLGSGNLGLAALDDTASTSTCVMKFELYDVERGQQFYRVQIGQHVARYSTDSVQFPLVMTFDR